MISDPNNRKLYILPSYIRFIRYENKNKREGFSGDLGRITYESDGQGGGIGTEIK